MQALYAIIFRIICLVVGFGSRKQNQNRVAVAGHTPCVGWSTQAMTRFRKPGSSEPALRAASNRHAIQAACCWPVCRVTHAQATHWTRSCCVLPRGFRRLRKPSPAMLPSLRENGAVRCFAEVPHAEHWARRRASVLRASFASQRGRCADGRRDDTSSRVLRARMSPSDARSDMLDQGGSQGRCRARHVAEDPSSGTTPTACDVPFTRTPTRAPTCAPTSVQTISQRACPGCARR